LRVLLVEDEDIFRTVLGRRLRKRGLDVSGVASGEEALAFLNRDRVDVVVLDVKMPGMSGIEALEQIKARFADLEVVMLTGFADATTAVRVMDRGAFAYLMKPVHLEDLIGEIKDAHDQVQSRRAESGRVVS
jgi:DNA-binding NtrC family response regulator